MGRNTFDVANTEKLREAELSKRLGQYQKQARTWRTVGLLGIAGGLIAAVAVQDAALKAILVAVLFGGGICCVLFLSNGAQKKLKTLMHEQLDGFFRSELEKTFGPDLHTQEMCIDQPLLETLHLLDGQWEECTVENYHEGSHCALHFSAANVRLNHVYQRGTIREGKETHSDMVFQGLVLRCKTLLSAPSAIRVNARTEDSPHGVVTGNDAFDRRFCVTAEKGQDAHDLLTPQFTEWISAFEQRVVGTLSCFCLEDGVLSLALKTDYGFAAVASNVDVRDLDAVRHSYCISLREMGETLDLLLQNTALFGGEIEKGERK